MSRKFRTPDYEETLNQTIRLGEALPPQHLARFVVDLIAQGEQVDQGEQQLPEGLVIQDKIAIREERLANLAKAKAVLEERAQERYAAEQAEYQAKLRERTEKARKTKRGPRGRKPKPPEPGPRDKDQYNFTDPDSRIMKNSTNEGVDQHYNVQVANDQDSLLMVAYALSNHPNDKQEALPTLDALDPRVGQLQAAAPDNGHFSEANIIAADAHTLPGKRFALAPGLAFARLVSTERRNLAFETAF
jgi:hypothetical protein